MVRKLLLAIVVEGDWGVLAIRALWKSMPKSNCAPESFICSNTNLKQLQIDFNYEEECEGGSDDILADECPAAADQDNFQFGFGSSIPGQNDKDGNPIITIIDRSGIHEIGARWCCCLNASELDMQLMSAGLFPATFQKPKIAFMFWVLKELHLDNLECKTTPSQFISHLRRLTSNEFPNTVPVSEASISTSIRFDRQLQYRIDIESY